MFMLKMKSVGERRLKVGEEDTAPLVRELDRIRSDTGFTIELLSIGYSRTLSHKEARHSP